MFLSGDGSDFVIECRDDDDGVGVSDGDGIAMAVPLAEVATNDDGGGDGDSGGYGSGDGDGGGAVDVGDGGAVREFFVHKFVLMAHSPVFRAMFEHEDTVESVQSRIRITDCSTTAMQHLLAYM